MHSRLLCIHDSRISCVVAHQHCRHCRCCCFVLVESRCRPDGGIRHESCLVKRRGAWPCPFLAVQVSRPLQQLEENKMGDQSGRVLLFGCRRHCPKLAVSEGYVGVYFEALFTMAMLNGCLCNPPPHTHTHTLRVPPPFAARIPRLYFQ